MRAEHFLYFNNSRIYGEELEIAKSLNYNNNNTEKWSLDTLKAKYIDFLLSNMTSSKETSCLASVKLKSLTYIT